MSPINIEMPYGPDMAQATLPAGRVLGTLDVSEAAALENRATSSATEKGLVR